MIGSFRLAITGANESVYISVLKDTPTKSTW